MVVHSISPHFFHSGVEVVTAVVGLAAEGAGSWEEAFPQDKRAGMKQETLSILLVKKRRFRTWRGYDICQGTGLTELVFPHVKRSRTRQNPRPRIGSRRHYRAPPSSDVSPQISWCNWSNGSSCCARKLWRQGIQLLRKHGANCINIGRATYEPLQLGRLHRPRVAVSMG